MKANIKKRFLIILGVGVFVVVLALLGFGNYGQKHEQIELEHQLAATKIKLSTFSTDKLLSEQSAVRTQIAKLSDEIDYTQSTLLVPLVAADICEEVIAIADWNGVKVTSLRSNGQTKAIINDTTCQVLAFNISVEGDVDGTYDFIVGLGENFNTAQIEPVEVIKSAKESDDVSSQTTADLKLIVYSYIFE